MVSGPDVAIRSLRGADFSAVAGIWNAIHPDAPTSVEEIQHSYDRIDRTRYVSEWMVAVDPERARVLAYGYYHHAPWAHHPDKYRAGLFVHPDHRQRGIGARMIREILGALERRGAARVTMWTREDHAPGAMLLGRFGFTEYVRDFESRLQVADADVSASRRHTERLAARGITITTLGDELARDPDCLRALYHIHCILDMSAPREDPDAPTPLAYQDFLRFEAQHPLTLPDGFFIAKHGELYIGESYLKRSDGDSQLLNQDLTGVLSLYQRGGIATALKLHTIEYAQHHGYREIRTFNSSLNTPILAINKRLGFVPRPAWVGYLKSWS
jgi:GNAT superfamily N-acetyltransferase